MKFLPLVWSGLWRKPVRAALIFLQVCVAFALFGVLQGMKTGMDLAIARFHLAVTPHLAVLGISWALGIGVISGLLPAVRAARVPVTVALRAK